MQFDSTRQQWRVCVGQPQTRNESVTRNADQPCIPTSNFFVAHLANRFGSVD